MRKVIILITLFFGIPFFGISQNSLSFDGIDDRLNCGNNETVQITGTNITLEAWVYPTSWRDNIWQGNIIDKENFAPQQGYMLRCGDGGRVNFNFGSTTAWNELNTDTPVLVLNEWQHIAATYDGVSQKIYINGILVAEMANANVIANTTENLTIGDNSSGSREFPGRIDEVKIWNTARTAAEILIDMENTYCPSALPLEGLQLYYPFDQGVAGAFNFGISIAFDFSGNGNNGILSSTFSLDGDESNWVLGVDGLIQNGGVPSELTIAACGSYTVPSGDETYTVGGIYMDTLIADVGCPEIITINLSFDGAEVESEMSVSACGSYTVPSGDETHTVSGVYMDTLSTVFGCDSILIIDLSINGAEMATIDVTTCEATYTVPSGDETYTIPGVYIDTISTIFGCDSILTINLSMNESSSAEIDAITCDVYTAPSGAMYSETGVFTDVILNTAGCDSVITINLTKIDLDLGVENMDPELRAIATGVSYQWVDCDNGFEPISGATNQTFTPIDNGNYAVIITDEECNGQSECFSIETVSIQAEVLNQTLIYPNPTSGVFRIRLDDTKSISQVIIRSIEGKLIQVITSLDKNVLEIELNEPAGVYFIELIGKNGVNSIKLVKK